MRGAPDRLPFTATGGCRAAASASPWTTRPCQENYVHLSSDMMPRPSLIAWEMLLESGHDPRSLATRRRNVPGEARRARVALGA